MEKSTVYFTDFRCKVGTSQLDKLKKLIEKAGIDSIDMDSKFVRKRFWIKIICGTSCKVCK